ncbi:hypothetical protein GCM10029976_035240 [Kribbella albertanoniae]
MIAASTRSRVAAPTRGRPLTTLDTVMVDTPADRATSAIVTTEAFFIQATLEVFGPLYTACLTG